MKIEEKTMFCQKCHIEYDESRKYCRNCGSPLSADKKLSSGDTGHPSLVERRRIVRICPRCHLHFEVGNYCRICGSPLEYEDITPDGERIQEKRLVKSLSSEWFRLTKRKNELEICLGNLTEQRNALPEDTFNLTFQSYQVQVESLSCRLQEMEARLGAIRTSVSKKIGLLEEESSAIQKRLDEIRSLHQLGVITSAGYSTEKNDINRQMRSRMKRLKECRKTISQLPSPLGEGSVSPMIIRNLIRYRSSAIVGGILIMIALGAYFIWTKNPEFFHPKESAHISQTETKPSVQGQLPVSSPEAREDEKIKFLFETIRRANLEKKIDLFMSCYAADFNGRNKKRLATLENWDHFDYLDLSYDLKRPTVTAHTAQVRVKWWITISPKHGGASEKTTSVLDVSLKKEDGHWKVKKIKPVS
jgi:RNA polymerase subunit RPABC4/transcription elongation factor Spt4